MKKLFAKLLGRLVKKFGEQEEIIVSQTGEIREEVLQEAIETHPIEESAIEQKIIPPDKIGKVKGVKKDKTKTVRKTIPKNISDKEMIPFVRDTRDIRDIMELMAVPFVSISKKRTTPIIYESPDGLSRIKISCHPPYYIASIYDWDIIIFVVSKLQEILNDKSDIPPRTLIVPRNELIKAIYKHEGKTTEKEIEAGLNRLQSTLVETTIHNEDYRYRGGFSFLDSWGYTERKDIKEFRITLSQWLYELTCHNGALLKVPAEYFKITSGFKRFLYRIARKHVGSQNNSWKLSLETLYERSGSEREFKKFKYDLRKAVSDNNIPSYSMKWVEEDGKTYVLFINRRKEMKKALLAPIKKPSYGENPL